MSDIPFFLVGTAYKILKDVLSQFSDDLKAPPVDVEARLSDHITFADAWSYRLETSGVPTPMETDSSSIELSISTRPRRFTYADKSNAGTISEIDVISDTNSYILLGDPGAGKTTTIKRCARKLLFDNTHDSEYRFPIIFRARYARRQQENSYNAHGFSDLITFLEELLGIQYRTPSKEAYDQGRIAKKAIVAFLNAFPCIIFIDGIDEVDSETYRTIVHQTTEISHLVAKSKFVVSCRSGASIMSLDGFTSIEIRPLSSMDIKNISKLIGVSHDGFQKELDSKSYRALASRPLVLSNLLFIYREERRLPDTSFEIYRLILNLLVERWDRERGISRTSSYGMQTVERKIDILSYIAYELSMQGITVFNAKNIENVFAKIGERLIIEASERTRVVEEIESHSGIIVQSSAFGFEFWHLSMQEFLAAAYIVKRPPFPDIYRKFDLMASCVAMAVATSSEPTEYFADTIVYIERYYPGTFTSAEFSVYIRRTLTEGVQFIQSPRLAGAFFIILSTVDREGDPQEALRHEWLSKMAIDYLDQMDLQLSEFTRMYSSQAVPGGDIVMSLRDGFLDEVRQFPRTITTTQRVYDRYLAAEFGR